MPSSSANKHAAFMRRYHSDPAFRAVVLERRRAHYKANKQKKIAYQRAWQASNPERLEAYKLKTRGSAKRLVNGARARAKKFGVDFDICERDVSIPEFCPVLGIRLQPGVGVLRFSSPTLDRIIPELGYVRGNVAVISMRANLIKSNATAEELEKVAAWVRLAADRGR